MQIFKKIISQIFWTELTGLSQENNALWLGKATTEEGQCDGKSLTVPENFKLEAVRLLGSCSGLKDWHVSGNSVETDFASFVFKYLIMPFGKGNLYMGKTETLKWEEWVSNRV